jgi:hypothetical protein
MDFGVRDSRSRRFLVVALWMVQLMQVVMIMGGRTDHPCWVRFIYRMSYFSNFLVVADKNGHDSH